jgi:osmoprotectant transport system permease protein
MDAFLKYLVDQGDRLVEATIEHAGIVLIAVALATIIGVTIGLLTYRTDAPRQMALRITGIFLTIPSFALFGLLVPLLGLGQRPAVVALVMYGLLPIVRNTIVGLRTGRYRRLLRIELPLAWPVIITGVRVASVIIVGIAAIAAVVNGPGLGKDIFRALARFGSPASVPQVLSAILGIIIIAILIDLAFVLVARFTTSKGIRA